MASPVEARREFCLDPCSFSQLRGRGKSYLPAMGYRIDYALRDGCLSAVVSGRSSLVG